MGGDAEAPNPEPTNALPAPRGVSRSVLGGDAEEDAAGVAVEVAELVFGEACEVLADAEAYVVFDDPVELDEHAVLPVLRE